MAPLTCDEAEPLLDLYAAGETDPATRRDIERHLDECDACSAALGHARAVQGWLDVHYQEPARLTRLRQRLRVEERGGQEPRGVLPFARRYVSVAALLLITLGLGTWVSVPAGEGPAGLTLIAVGPTRAVPGGVELSKDHLQEMARAAASDKPLRLTAPVAIAKPDVTPLEFTLRVANTTPRPVVIALGDPATELDLGLMGSGVRAKGWDGPPPAWATPREARLEPGDQLVIPVEGLIDGTPGRLRHYELTAPGEYRLRPQLRFACREESGLTWRGCSTRGQPVVVTVPAP